MAIVSISRIQHRRGLQQDLPQLAAAELGWSLDSQRLYIGNGPISEGSPRLGNTEVLTQYSDVLKLAETYTYLNEDAGYTPTTGGRTNRFNAIAFGDGLYIVVGNNGSILTSSDTTTWTPVYGATTFTLNDICYGDGMFVAVGASGTIIYSTDGSVWNAASTNTFLTLTSIVYAGGVINNYVAASNTGKIIYSTDADAWTVVAPAQTADVSLNSIAYYDDLIVVAGNGGVVATSSNITSWTLATIPTSYNLQTVMWNNDQWMIGGDYSTVLVSLDAIEWVYGFTDTFRAAANSSTTWVFVGDGGVIYSTTDTDLSIVTSPTTENLFDVTYSLDDTQFVAVGANGIILTSSDGATWTEGTSGTLENLNKVVYDPDNALYLIVGTNGTLLTSDDSAVTWTPIDISSVTTVNLYGIAVWPESGSLTYIAVGDGGEAITSPNSLAWTAQSTGITDDLQSVTVADLGGGTYKTVAVGMNGLIITSDDAGITWDYQASGTSNDLHGINYITYTYNLVTSSRYLAVGNNGLVLSSNDAVTWTTRDVNSTGHLFNIYYGLNNFWLVGSVGYSTIFGADVTVPSTLTNQAITIVFSSISGFGGPTFYASSYGLEKYLLVGQYNSILASEDGQNFVSQTGRTFDTANLNYANIYDTIFEDGQFLSVGNKGLVLSSSTVSTWSGTSYVYGDSRTVRSLQRKLDEYVSIKDFGAKGDGITDDTEAINRALFELYCRTPNPAARKALIFPAGRYIVSDGINVPTNAILKGEGAGNTIIQQIADPTYVSYVLTTADDKQQTGAQLGFNGAVLPADIIVEDMGLESSGDGVWLIQGSRITFSRVRMTGSTELATTAGNQWTGIYIIGSSLTPPTDINFIDCYLEKFNYGVFQDDTEYSRNLRFESTTFVNMYEGIVLCLDGGQVNTMTISNCVFDLIYSRAINANYVTNITSTFNSFRDVGNYYQGIGSAVVENILFGTSSTGCASINDQFDRTQEESYATAAWVIGNSHTVMLAAGHELRIGLWEQAGGESYTLLPDQADEPVGLTYRINDNSYNQKIHYVIVRGNSTRSGTLWVTYNTSSGDYNVDDDSSETSDVGVVFSADSDGTDLSILYTSTNGGDPFDLTIAETYLDMSWQ